MSRRLSRELSPERLHAGFHSPFGFAAAMTVFTLWLLAADRFVGREGQLVLAAVTWVVLLFACRPLPVDQRVAVGFVVVVASALEVFCALVWGLYHYRLGNLPLFVPPGHGIVYLAALKLSRAPVVRRNPRVFVRGVLAIVLLWAVAGVSVLPRADVLGAVFALVFAAFLLWGSVPTVYAGVFLVVTALELYGTVVGTWRWESVTPWLGLSAGNPPSGVVGLYVLANALALAVAAQLATLAVPARRRLSHLRA